MRRYFHSALLDEASDAGTERSDAERWILSYADFVTLLFAFFVVMYSISSVNDGKFRVLSASLLAVFENPAVSAVIERQRAAAQPAAATAAAFDAAAAIDTDWLTDLSALRADQLAPALEAWLGDAIAAGTAAVSESADYTEVTLPADLAFGADSAELTGAAAALLDQLAILAAAADTQVRIEGYTDNVPRVRGPYASNWSLSAAHAATIAARLVDAGVDAERVSAAGFGERYPVTSNASNGGRAANRRVVIAIARHDQVPLAAASHVARSAREALPARTLQRITELPGPQPITL